MSQLSVIIPTLYPSTSLLDYSERIRGYSGVKEVIIVINADQRVLKQAENSTIKVIALGKNKGFTGGCNAGARASTGSILLFLNDDCEMDEENFTKLVDFLEKNPELVATQPIVYRQNPNPNIQIPKNNISPRPSAVIENIGFMINTRIGKAFAVQDLEILKPSFAQGFEWARQVQNDNSIENLSPTTYPLAPRPYLYGLSGTCLLIRKDIFEKVGMWDESFHSYLEDVDLALRMRKFGYKFAPCLDAAVAHAHMATSSRMGMYKPMQDMKNWWRLIMKHPDIFVHANNLVPLLLERGRNASGVVKRIIRM